MVARNRYFRELAVAALRQARLPVYQFQSSATGEVSADEDAVRVSSLHGAKGHEFGTVFIVGAADGVIPQRAAQDSDALTGKAAVLYVGMTRARDLLYISHSDEDANGRPRKRSAFIDRIVDAVDQVAFRH